MTSYERRLAEPRTTVVRHDQASGEGRAGEVRAMLAERAEQIRRKVETQGAPLIERLQQLMLERPKETLAGIALASYIAGKLLRGRPRRD